MGLTLQWLLLLVFLGMMVWLSPRAKSKGSFYGGEHKAGKQPGTWLLVSSLVISWIFAKSITNAANLGLTSGIVGGVAYATYYLSFLFAGIIIFRMRVIGGYQSIHDFLNKKFGTSAIIVFSLLIGFRLFNEVWSNTMVIGTYFGEVGSQQYYFAIISFTAFTLFYSLKGGLQASLLTDAIQMILFGSLLLIILVIILPEGKSESAYLSSGEWSLEGGLDLMLVALVQVFSYPFHDPVMTDRGFVSDPRKTLKAFLIATPIGFLAIVLFSLLGVYAGQQGFSGQAAVEVAKSFGIVLMLIINFIMITSASSTLDSAFASFSKLINIDLKLFGQTIFSGRLVMILMAALGTIPVFLSPTVLSATTISGTMVIGLAPVFLFWRARVARSAFLWSVLSGVAIGFIYVLGLFPTELIFFPTPYGTLLSVNLIGSMLCFLTYFISSLFSGSKN